MAKTLLDTDAGQVKVETGQGVIQEIKQADGKRNAQVIINADHLKFGPVAGWFDTYSDGWDEIQVGMRVRYEIRTRRKANIDPAIPLDEIKNPRDKVRDMVKLIPEKAGRATAAPAPTPSPDPRPRPSGDGMPPHHSAPVEPRPIPVPLKTVCGECGYGPDQCSCDAPSPSTTGVRQAGLDATAQRHDLTERQGPTKEELVADATAFARDGGLPIPAPPRKKGPKIEEGKPWEERNTDGSMNLASYAFGAANGFVQLAHKLVADRIRRLTEEGATAVNLTTSNVESLARYLLIAADQAQAMTRQDGRVDRMDQSHTRARSAVREALWVYPVPWGVDSETRNAWVEQVARHAAELMRIALVLHEEYDAG